MAGFPAIEVIEIHALDMRIVGPILDKCGNYESNLRVRHMDAGAMCRVAT